MPSDTSAPLVLGFDTSGPHCAAALVRAGELIEVRVEQLARGQAERLMILLEDLLVSHGLAWSDLDALGVGIGPGNFTGIRISVSAARGLGLGLGVPVVGVSLFDTTRHLGTWARTAVPAPRDQFYVFDPDKMTTPVLAPTLDDLPVALSTDHSVGDHVHAIAMIAAGCAHARTPPPKPLYVKRPDAAPARDTPPRVLT